MRKKLVIEKVERKDRRLYLINDHPPFSLEEARPKGHMLVDSDHLSFIYILETDEDFIYVAIPYEFWNDVKQALAEEAAVVLKSGELELELTSFKEELTYLIENIDGNANYGEQMEQAVKEIFLT
ncbi:UPF0738 family protein [Saccharococcus caldoxylosilyticus]|jgi:hypothetical protein|uniref:UPF0738 protein GCA01S_057_00250 n=2 Tax=Saccharococcus caldoxylosilyticus TaxID=81408 RepID=A0A023DJC1_9BACL|nr:hypothetical protein [Parageobacillus caldoxylosilyticus]OQP02977.1 hypothetical protein BSK33_09355 [Geobacillus sp. 44B]KYD10529.1 hypothetical protein B4119_0869 [Parageobacillus caldoxylosilyticus]MBB3854155.1 hypothetical protein [Parageobacillus caldoxylosilyticus]QNU38077.1 hypothetical protein IC801_01615 [Geobacillus sp. 44B]QXJ37709.1 hypothetical protein BV455_00972 [Parageobacillus caldoxylosilyticus]